MTAHEIRSLVLGNLLPVYASEHALSTLLVGGDDTSSPRCGEGKKPQPRRSLHRSSALFLLEWTRIEFRSIPRFDRIPCLNSTDDTKTDIEQVNLGWFELTRLYLSSAGIG